jgi:hypothetical protein
MQQPFFATAQRHGSLSGGAYFFFKGSVRSSFLAFRNCLLGFLVAM